MDIYETIVRAKQEGKRIALATIVRHLGSTPRKDNAKMLVYEDGSTFGSVGGGCVEGEIWQKAREVLDSGQARLFRFELTEEDAENDGLVCGGTVEIFVEPIVPEPRLVILGAGHLGKAMAEAALPLGYEVVVIDDRESFASRERFPQAREVRTAPFEECLRGVDVNSGTFILIVTRGHRHDVIALRQAVRTNARYIGLVGSRRKIQLSVQSLLDQGFAPSLFERLYAPIGLEIGSETPEEIAVSVIAEIIALRKGVHRRSEKQLFVRRLLEKQRA
jgi:xanthine dehydrogenase accessory factor